MFAFAPGFPLIGSMNFLTRLFSRKSPEPGPVYRVPEGHLVYAVGDIHGRLDLLEQLVGLIKADATERRAREPIEHCSLIFLGDYVDRGFHSKQVLDYLQAAELDGFEVMCLRGNHEEMMLEFIDDPLGNEGWLHFGGVATMASYGAKMEEGDSGQTDLVATASAFDDKFPRTHRDFIRSMPFLHQIGDYVFVHAGLRPGVFLEAQQPEDMMYIRQEFTESRYDFGVRVVHGHTGVQNPLELKRRIAVDTIAYATGRLTAAVLFGESVDFITT